MNSTPSDTEDSVTRLRQRGLSGWLVVCMAGPMTALSLFLGLYMLFWAEPEAASPAAGIVGLGLGVILGWLTVGSVRTGYDLCGDTLLRYNGLNSRRSPVSRSSHIGAVEQQRAKGGTAGASITQTIIWTTDPDRPKSRLHRIMGVGRRPSPVVNDGPEHSPVIVATHMLTRRDQTALYQWFLAHGLEPTTSQPYPLQRPSL